MSHMDPQLYSITQQLEQLGKYLEGLMLELKGVDTNLLSLNAGKTPNPKLLRAYVRAKQGYDKWVRHIKWVMMDPYYLEHPDDKQKHAYHFMRVAMIYYDLMLRAGEQLHQYKKSIRVLLSPFAAGEPTDEVVVQSEDAVKGIRKKFDAMKDKIAGIFTSKPPEQKVPAAGET